MRKRLTVLFLMLLTSAVWADPLKITSRRVYAGSEMVKPIYLEVTVVNEGSQKVTANLYLTLTPEHPPERQQAPDQNGDPDLWDPYELNETVVDLAPGKSAVVKFKTPYKSDKEFQTSDNLFPALSPAPNSLIGSIRVRYKLEIK